MSEDIVDVRQLGAKCACGANIDMLAFTCGICGTVSCENCQVKHAQSHPQNDV